MAKSLATSEEVETAAESSESAQGSAPMSTPTSTAAAAAAAAAAARNVEGSVIGAPGCADVGAGGPKQNPEPKSGPPISDEGADFKSPERQVNLRKLVSGSSAPEVEIGVGSACRGLANKLAMEKADSGGIRDTGGVGTHLSSISSF